MAPASVPRLGAPPPPSPAARTSRSSVRRRAARVLRVVGANLSSRNLRSPAFLWTELRSIALALSSEPVL